MSFCILQFVFTVLTGLLTTALVGRKSHLSDPVPKLFGFGLGFFHLNSLFCVPTLFVALRLWGMEVNSSCRGSLKTC